MAEKILNTRIRLKYDSFANWTSKNPTLLEGELAIAYLAESHTSATPDNSTHPVLFKVGPGAFNSLPWASALAADVYSWAKAANVKVSGKKLQFVNIVNEKDEVVKEVEFDFISPSELSTELAKYFTKEEINTLIASYSTTEQMNSAIAVETQRATKAEEDLGKRIDAFNLPEGGFASKSEFDTLKGKVEDEDGALARANAAYDLADAARTETEVDGQIDAKITALGLGTMSKEAASDYVKKAEASGYNDILTKTEAQNTYKKTADLRTDLDEMYTNAQIDGFVQDAAKAGTNAAAAVLGADTDAATANTVYGAKAAAAAAQSDATIAKTKIETFLDVVAPEGSTEIIDTLSEIQAELERLDDAVEIEKQLATKVDKTVYEEHLTAQAEKDAAQDKALTDAIAAEVQRADGKYEEKGVAQGLINGLGTMAKEDKANYFTKTEIEKQVATEKLVADTIVGQVSISATEIGAETLSVGTTGGEIKIDEAGGFQVIGSGSGSESVLFSLKAEEAMGEELVVDGTEQAKNSFNEWLGTEAIAKAAADAIVLPVVNNGKLTVTTGTGLTGSGEFTANQEGDTAIAVALSTETIASLGKADELYSAIISNGENHTYPEGFTVVDIAYKAEKLGDHNAEYFATAEGLASANKEIAKKANDADLAAIAKTGNVNDLIQTEGDILVFNCGSASTVI